MSQLGENFANTVVVAVRAIDEGEWGQPFAAGFCGPDNQFRSLVEAIQTGPCDATASRSRLKDGLDQLDRLFGVDRTDGPPGDDATLQARWAGLSNIARTVLTNAGSDDFTRSLTEAKRHFDRVWEAVHPEEAPDPAPLWADPATAKQADKGLFAKLNPALAPWTPGSWMVWDALTQLNGTAMPAAAERTWVLFGDGGELAVHLVVEALPGPPGLVTPNWWLIGLTRFPTANPDRWFVTATQQALRSVAAQNPSHRLRWHLEPAAGRSCWLPLEGRSGMAAATAVGLAAFERLDPTKAPRRDDEPVLDQGLAITAVADTAPAGYRVEDCRLSRVSDTTLRSKFLAAKAVGIDTVFVAKGQNVADHVKLQEVDVIEVATVGEAFEQLRSMKQVIDDYREFTRAEFEYFEDPSPDT